jgi:hypothetical protein
MPAPFGKFLEVVLGPPAREYFCLETGEADVPQFAIAHLRKFLALSRAGSPCGESRRQRVQPGCEEGRGFALR